MNKMVKLLIIIIVTFASMNAQEKSDYATVQRFENMTQSIAKSIDEAKTVQECVAANTAIDALVNEFREDRDLLDKSIYPEGFDKTIFHLRGSLLVRQKDLGIIESQIVRLTELEGKVQELSDQLAKINGQNERLAADVQRMSQNVKQLTGDMFTSATPIDSLRNTIVRLRQGLQERDALIFALTDSLFLQYDKNVADMKDVEKQGLLGKMERHGIVGNVKRSIIDNMTFLEATQLRGNDLVLLVRQQQRFQSQWSGLAPKLASLYLTGKAKKTDVITVDSLLAVWGDKVDGAMWRSLNVLFKEKGFLIKEFRTGEEFSLSLGLFLEDQIQNVNKESDNTRFKLFTNFYENLWQSDLNSIWLSALVELHKMSNEQKKEIETKIEAWKLAVKPGSGWLIYLLIILGGVLIILLIVQYARKKSKDLVQNQEEHNK
jgi:hypothetical protein